MKELMMSIVSTRRSLVLFGLLAIGVFGLVALASHVQRGQAAIGPPVGGSGTPGFGSAPTAPTPTCKIWPTPPRIVVHTSEFLAGEGLLGSEEEQPMEQAIEDVVAQFNRSIDGPSVLVSGVTTTTAPFHWAKPFHDTTPTIHVGFTSDIAKDLNGEEAGGVTTMGGPVNDANGCPLERDIEFPTADDPSQITWDFNTPFTAYRDSTCGPAADPTNYEYYDAGQTDCYGNTWFRPSFLHELLHAFGRVHTTSQYSFMNHRGDGVWAVVPDNIDSGGFPWVNAYFADAVRPLPVDVAVLRGEYAGSSDYYDVAVLNTWYRPADDPTDDAAWQTKLCIPSVGSSWSAQTSAGTCGVGGSNGGSTSVHVGDKLKTRYTLANYSSGSVQVTSELYLSKNETWEVNDTPTATHVDDVAAGTSIPVKAEWTIPNHLGSDLHPIVHITAEHINADGSPDPASIRVSWIPLRGTITVS
jgi:hypothetical protein